MIDFSKIELIVSDLDGTLTDGCYRITEDGIIEKSFYSRDFFSIQKAQENGMWVLIFTHSEDLVIDKKIEMLPQSCKEKLLLNKVPMEICKKEALRLWLEVEGVEHFGYELDLSQIAYIGDGENDLLAMKGCQWTGCPADAASIIKQGVDHCTERSGGYGAVNEFIMNIILKRKTSEEFSREQL